MTEKDRREKRKEDWEKETEKGINEILRDFNLGEQGGSDKSDADKPKKKPDQPKK